MNLVRAATLIVVVTIFTTSPVAAKKSKKKKLVMRSCHKYEVLKICVSKYSLNANFILVLLSNKFQFDFESDNVRCLVCQAVADEFLIAINRVDPKKKTEGMSSFRLDANGNQKKNVVGYHIQYLIHQQCKHRYNTEGDSIECTRTWNMYRYKYAV